LMASKLFVTILSAVKDSSQNYILLKESCESL